MSITDFEILAKLGEGAYSSVFKVRRLVDETVYALKKVKLSSMSPREIHNAVNEVRILASIRHPSIIGYKEAFFDSPSKSLCIVMEYADSGDLLQKILDAKKRNQQFPESYIWDVFGQILQGLEKLHNMGIFHRDIKSANVFLAKNGAVKLGDMNVSKVVRKQSMCETQTGTPYYASPQVWKDEPYDSKSDIWSLGCVLYEMISLKPPFRGRDMQTLFRKVTRGYYSKIHNDYSEELTILLRCLIRVNPEQRLSCKEVTELIISKKKIKAKKLEIEDESILLKTIKVTKNINYLTENLPKPNYSPLKYKSLLSNRSSELGHRKKGLYDLRNPTLGGVSLVLSERNIKVNKSERKHIRYHEKLPKIVQKKRDQGYIY